jgi:hypothetical protein
VTKWAMRSEKESVVFCDLLAQGQRLCMATNCMSVHGIYIALEPSLDGKEPTAFKAVVLSLY